MIIDTGPDTDPLFFPETTIIIDIDIINYLIPFVIRNDDTSIILDKSR